MKKLAWFVPLALLVTSEDARAAEGVKRIGIQGGFAGVTGEGSFAGGGGGVSFGYSVTDAITIGASATATSNQVADTGGRSWIFAQSIGATYALDVIQFVPYFGVYAGVYEMTGGGLPTTRVKGGAQLALGLDWVYSRSLTFGLELRAHALPQDFFDSPDDPTAFYATSFLKAEYTWGWF